MQILSLTNCPLDPKLGSGKTVVTYTQGLRSLGHTVDILEPKDYETGYKLPRAKKFRQAWGAWGLVRQKLRTEQYDLIEFYGDEFWLATWQLSKRQKRPLLVAHTNGLELLDTERSHAYKPLPSPFNSWFARQTHVRFSYMAFAHADAFVSLCGLDREYVLNLGLYPVERTTVVEPGLDHEYRAMPFIPKKEERVAFMGTWTARKGVSNLSAVMTKVLTQNQNLYFDIYGTGGARDTVLACFPAEIHHRIIIYPPLSNQEIAEGLARANIFFFPSQYEGFGIALSEAMACSCAVVTTPTGFGADLHHGQEALLCDFNDVDAMEQALLQLLQDEELRLKIAEGGWERVRSLDWDANIKKLEATYCQWIKEHQKSL